MQNHKLFAPYPTKACRYDYLVRLRNLAYSCVSEFSKGDELQSLALGRDHGNGRLMQHDKICSLKNIALVAREFGENEQLLWDVVA